jgi:hypothetical protein
MHIVINENFISYDAFTKISAKLKSPRALASTSKEKDT